MKRNVVKIIYRTLDEELLSQVKEFAEYVTRENERLSSWHFSAFEYERYLNYRKKNPQKPIGEKEIYLFVSHGLDDGEREVVYNQYGITISMDSHILEILVDEKYSWTREEYDEFLELVQQGLETTPEDTLAKKEAFAKERKRYALQTTGGLIFFPPYGLYKLYKGGKTFLDATKDSKKRVEQMKFYAKEIGMKEYFQKFMMLDKEKDCESDKEKNCESDN